MSISFLKNRVLYTLTAFHVFGKSNLTSLYNIVYVYYTKTQKENYRNLIKIIWKSELIVIFRSKESVTKGYSNFSRTPFIFFNSIVIWNVYWFKFPDFNHSTKSQPLFKDADKFQLQNIFHVCSWKLSLNHYTTFTPCPVNIYTENFMNWWTYEYYLKLYTARSLLCSR